VEGLRGGECGVGRSGEREGYGFPDNYQNPLPTSFFLSTYTRTNYFLAKSVVKPTQRSDFSCNSQLRHACEKVALNCEKLR
jgi:hypothetical protein